MSEESSIIIMFSIVVIAPFVITLLAFTDYINVHETRTAAINQEAQPTDN